MISSGVPIRENITHYIGHPSSSNGPCRHLGVNHCGIPYSFLSSAQPPSLRGLPFEKGEINNRPFCKGAVVLIGLLPDLPSCYADIKQFTEKPRPERGNLFGGLVLIC